MKPKRRAGIWGLLDNQTPTSLPATKLYGQAQLQWLNHVHILRTILQFSCREMLMVKREMNLNEGCSLSVSSVTQASELWWASDERGDKREERKSHLKFFNFSFFFYLGFLLWGVYVCNFGCVISPNE